MTHAPDAFLDAVLAAPEDDGPRLVYADWLEERGDPRGEFIRTQITWENLAEDDPRRWELAVRARALTCRHGKGRAGPLRRLVKRWQFRRGFVESVTLQADAFLKHAEELFRRAPIRSVRLLAAEPHLEALARGPHLKSLHGLDLRHTPGLTPDRLRVLLRARGPGLLFLGLRGTGLCNGPGLWALAESSELADLKTLDLSDHRRDAIVNGVQALEQRGLIPGEDEDGLDWTPSPDAVKAFTYSAHLRNLRALSLGGYGASIPEYSLRDLANSPLMAGLEELEVSGLRPPRTVLQFGVLDVFAESERTAGLRRLRIERVQRGTTWDCLHDAPFAANLRELDIEDHSFTGGRLGNIAEALPHLHTLRARNCQFLTRDLEALTDSAALPSLRELLLDESRVKSDGLLMLLESPVLPRLRALSFSGRGGLSSTYRVNQTTWQKFLSSPHLANLVRLDLGNQYLGDAATMTLAASPHLTSLRELVLWRNDIKAHGADAILKSESLAGLELLDLRSNPLPAATIRELRERFGPGVRYGRGKALTEDLA